jgi:hypothetical protein
MAFNPEEEINVMYMIIRCLVLFYLSIFCFSSNCLSVDNLNWSPENAIGHYPLAGSPPSLTVFNKRLYLFHKGFVDSGEIWYKSSADGIRWEPDTRIKNIFLSGFPSAAVFNGRLYLAYQGVGNTGLICYTSSADGIHWDPETQIKNILLSGSPQLFTFNNRLCIAYQDFGGLGMLSYIAAHSMEDDAEKKE